MAGWRTSPAVSDDPGAPGAPARAISAIPSIRIIDSEMAPTVSARSTRCPCVDGVRAARSKTPLRLRVRPGSSPAHAGPRRTRRSWRSPIVSASYARFYLGRQSRLMNVGGHRKPRRTMESCAAVSLRPYGAAGRRRLTGSCRRRDHGLRSNSEEPHRPSVKPNRSGRCTVFDRSADP